MKSPQCLKNTINPLTQVTWTKSVAYSNSTHTKLTTLIPLNNQQNKNP